MEISTLIHQLEAFLRYVYQNNINNYKNFYQFIFNGYSHFELYLDNNTDKYDICNKINHSFIFNSIDINIIFFAILNSYELHIFIENEIDAKILKILVDENIFILENPSRISINPVKHLIFKSTDHHLLYHGVRNSNFPNFDIDCIQSYLNHSEKNNICLFFRPSKIIFGDFFNLILDYPYCRTLPSNMKND